MLVYWQARRTFQNFRDLDRSIIPDIDADDDTVSRTAPFAVDVAKQLDRATSRPIPCDHRIVTERH